LGKLLPLAGVATAVVVAGTIVFIGSAMQGDVPTAGVATPGATASLPAGHLAIGGGGAPATTPSAEPLAQSVRRLEKARAADPDDVDVLLELGDAYFMAQRLRQAEDAYSEARALAPDDPAAQVGLAMVRHAQGDSRRAESMLRAVIEEHPDDQDAHYSLAIVCFSAGRVDEAKEQWQAAAAIDPRSLTGRRSQSFVDLLEDQQSGAPAAD
jgi:cytochrome c-type biogenesis protein CcmH/NrfG